MVKLYKAAILAKKNILLKKTKDKLSQKNSNKENQIDQNSILNDEKNSSKIDNESKQFGLSRHKTIRYSLKKYLESPISQSKRNSLFSKKQNIKDIQENNNINDSNKKNRSMKYNFKRINLNSNKNFIEFLPYDVSTNGKTDGGFRSENCSNDINNNIKINQNQDNKIKDAEIIDKNITEIIDINYKNKKFKVTDVKSKIKI